jgi:multiple sugar transport system substrate-binding protein
MLKRYLTPFYRFALGLSFVIILAACKQQSGMTVETQPVASQTAIAQGFSPTPTSEQANSRKKPTPLPVIPPTPNQLTPTNLGVSSVDLKGTVVEVWQPWAGNTGDELKETLDAYSQTNQWGISVQVQSFPDFGSLDEAMETAISTQELPDVIVDYGYQAQHWNTNDVLTDLTPYVNDPVWGLTNGEQADFLQSFWSEDLVEDPAISGQKRLGIPFYRSAYALFYNQSWAKELGFASPPHTPQDFKKQACAAAQATAAQMGNTDANTGGWLITPQPATLVGWIYAMGGQLTQTGSTSYTFTTAESQEAFEYIKDLQDNGCAWYETTPDTMSAFANRQALFMVGSLYDIPAQQEAFSQAGNIDEWVVIPFPSDAQPVVVTYGPSLMITHTTPAQQLADWLVVKWLVYPPNLTQWVTATGTLPTRNSILGYLSQNGNAASQWGLALELLPDGRGEPCLASWSIMRWALNDALDELLSPQLSADQIPVILQNLDSLAEELVNQER